MGDSYMKNIRYLFMMILLLVFPSVKALECSPNDMVMYRELAKNIDIKYEYLGQFSNEDDAGFITDKYRVTIQGITPELSIGVVDYTEEETVYLGNELPDGSVSFETFLKELDFNIYVFDCSDEPIKTTSLTLPTKNPYASSNTCSVLEEYHLDICDEWYQGNITPELYEEAMEKYLKPSESFSNKMVDFLKKNYFIVIIGVAFFLGLVILLIYRHRKRSVLE